MNLEYQDKITLCGMSTEDRWFESTLKAIIYSKNVTGIKKAQLLSSKSFYHPEVECIQINKFNNADEYNFFMLKKYGEYISTDFALNIHDDGFVLNLEAWTDEFLDYDYIGSLWTVVSPNSFYGVNENNRVGGGGFSLRSKKFFEVVKEFCPFMSGWSEDVTFARMHRDTLLSKGVKFAPNDLAAKFCIEDDEAIEFFGQSHQDYTTIKTFGFHNKACTAIKLLDNIKL